MLQVIKIWSWCLGDTVVILTGVRMFRTTVSIVWTTFAITWPSKMLFSLSRKCGYVVDLVSRGAFSEDLIIVVTSFWSSLSIQGDIIIQSIPKIFLNQYNKYTFSLNFSICPVQVKKVTSSPVRHCHYQLMIKIIIGPIITTIINPCNL